MLLKKLVNHSSLFVIMAGAGGFFLTNIILKIALSPIEFGQFSLVITYLSLMYIFGLFGFEQVFIRLSRVIEINKITTQQYQIRTAIQASLLSSVLGTVVFNALYPEIKINFLLLFLATFSMTNLMLIFTIFRLNSDFFLAQLIVNFWKVALFLAAGIFFASKFQFPFIETVLVTVIIGFVASWYLLRRRIGFVYNQEFSKKEIKVYFLQFFLSILIFSFLSFGDRFVFSELFGIEEFGNYYYLSNFFLAPFSIFQNYIGFKQIVQFKESCDRKIFDRLIFKIFSFGFVFALVLIIITAIVDQMGFLNFAFHNHLISIALLLLIGITRLYYAAIAAMFEALASPKTLKMVNLNFLLFLTTVSAISFFLIKTVNQLIFAVLIVWVFRCFIFRVILFRQIRANH
ncbi:hypothetical protein G4D82_11160 [Flavobacterium sp. CYK-4]|uniref:hypothetical protein n=1 Tax=Flavobacterium lotistagni TaxID=2709660 RepID=UPI00140ABBB1|nr:hypothetical protein [Flavobacterium lotistagni]NHM07781.1 hypothetical protein [Flavobacterium lotistagni]